MNYRRFNLAGVLLATLSPAALFAAVNQAPPDVAQAPADAVVLASGVAVRLLQAGAGNDHPSGDDCVVVRFTSWKRDGTLAATSGGPGQTTTQCLSVAMPGVVVALHEMTAGEKRRVWIPAGLSYRPEDATQGPALTADLELVSIIKAPTRPLDLAVPPSDARRLPSGVAIRVLHPGLGTTHPAAGSRVLVNYSSWSSDGKLVETTAMEGRPASILLGTAVPGLQETLLQMSTGDRVRAWIPGPLAYGDHPKSKRQPAGPLVYDVELLKVD